MDHNMLLVAIVAFVLGNLCMMLIDTLYLDNQREKVRDREERKRELLLEMLVTDRDINIFIDAITNKKYMVTIYSPNESKYYISFDRYGPEIGEDLFGALQDLKKQRKENK